MKQECIRISYKDLSKQPNAKVRPKTLLIEKREASAEFESSLPLVYAVTWCVDFAVLLPHIHAEILISSWLFVLSSGFIPTLCDACVVVLYHSNNIEKAKRIGVKCA